MRRRLGNLQDHIFTPDMTLEERVFNLLCLVGFFLVFTAAFVRGLWIAGNMLTFAYLFIAAALLGLSLTFFKRLRARRPVVILLLCAVLDVLFPLSFFSSGGIDSGLTAYFVLSLSVLFVLLRGKTCAIMVCCHIATVMTCYYLGYTRPDLVTPLSAPYMVHIDSVLAIAISGFVPCLLIKTQTDAYIAEKRNALMAAKARSDFLANISHEIRTPLNAIIGVSEMEIRANHDPAGLESLKQMHGSGVTLLGIINDILDISKMEAGRFDVRPEQYDFASLALDIVSMNMEFGGKRHLDFKVKISGNTPSVLYGDETCIKQIAGNILSNAFKYTEAGSVELEISSENAPGDKRCRLKITIADTGKGIRPEDQDRIFSDYSKLDTGATAIEGIGLGLTICKKLTEIMDGSIRVQSELGKGSRFTVVIPQKIIDPHPIGKETADRINSAPHAMGAHQNGNGQTRFTGNVLVVDDVEINREIAKSIFEEYGLKVDTAMSGKQALDMLQNGGRLYDLVFLDHLMPGMSGAETLREIRKLNSKNANSVPIIGLTARERGEGGESDFFDEIQDLVSKPMDMQRLEKVLAKWLKK